MKQGVGKSDSKCQVPSLRPGLELQKPHALEQTVAHARPIAFLGECTAELNRARGEMKNTATSRLRNSSTNTEEN